jgi:hypothetical protein
MMHVDPQPEPGLFHDRVRVPGNGFLDATPHPTEKQWSSRNYWTRVSREMHVSYGGICMYSCHWIPHDTGSKTIDHFRPKDTHPRDAYEWSNFRLVCGTLNGRKSGYEDVLDPFAIRDGMFVISFPSAFVKPSRSLTVAERGEVEATICRLKLNDEGTCLLARINFIDLYCRDIVSFPYLEQEAPFIAFELRRQRLTSKIKSIWIQPI